MSRAQAAVLLGVLWAGALPARAQIYTRLNGNGVVEATNIPDAGDFRLTYPGKGTLIHSRGFQGVYHGEFDHHIEAAASVHSVSTDLVRAVIQVESEFDQLAVSSKGAQGLMQLMPATARRFGVGDPFDARQNIFAGVQYLRLLLDLFQGDVALSLAAYNAGENAVARFRGVPPYRETRTYVQRILGLLGAGPGVGPGPGLAEMRASFFAPVRAAARSSKPVKLVPARPRIYYKWKDESGSLHVAQTPPGEGVLYTMIRALD